MKNILLATDLTPNADRALVRAIKLASETGAQLHVIHVVPPYPFKKTKQLTQSLKEELEDIINKHIKAYRGANNLKPSITVVQAVDNHLEILKHAHKARADLLVMGMHGKSKFRDLFVGTTIERVIRKGLKPVLMVKNIPADSYQDVLCGIDFSSGSRAALRVATDIAPNADFHLVHAYEIPYYAEATYEYVVSKALVEEKHQKNMDNFLKQEIAYFKKQHPKARAEISGKLVPGVVHKVLVKKAKSLKVDLLAIGAHGQVGFVLPSSKLGGSAQEILINPPCDVLVVNNSTNMSEILI